MQPSRENCSNCAHLDDCETGRAVLEGRASPMGAMPPAAVVREARQASRVMAEFMPLLSMATALLSRVLHVPMQLAFIVPDEVGKQGAAMLTQMLGQPVMLVGEVERGLLAGSGPSPEEMLAHALGGHPSARQGNPIEELMNQLFGGERPAPESDPFDDLEDEAEEVQGEAQAPTPADQGEAREAA